MKTKKAILCILFILLFSVAASANHGTVIKTYTPSGYTSDYTSVQFTLGQLETILYSPSFVNDYLAMWNGPGFYIFAYFINDLTVQINIILY